jgi:acetyl-CoA C-acetyltransferase
MRGREPVVVGVAQLLGREEDPRAALSPLAALARLARAAADDAGAGERLLRAIDTCALVEVAGWSPANGPALLAESLGACPRRTLVSAVGGEMGLTLLGRVAGLVAAGEARVAFVAGCNNLRTLRVAQARGIRLAWETGGTGAPEVVGVTRAGSSALELRYGLGRPVDVYPLFENALRARRGLAPQAHLANVGRLMSRFTEVAARNPYAWFPVRRSADELVTVTPRNRMIAYPYPKYLNAVIDTDQAAGCFVVSAAAARALGVPRSKWVFWGGGAHAEEAAWYPCERRDFHSSPALAATAGAALARAGVGVDDVDAFDFYSCFPVAVEIACQELGLAEDDPRGLTVTGGLPYAGGPASNYTLHAVAAMCERLRERPGARGLVTGNGWYLTKHSAAVLASAPPDGAPHAPPPPAALPPPLPLLAEASGPARIETYTVVYDRDGAPERGIVVGRLVEGGHRFLANTPPERALLEELTAAEAVGRLGHVRCEDGENRFVPA